MFTGIVEEIGTVRQIKKGKHSAVLTISAGDVLDGTKTGDSIAVNGICLTVTAVLPGAFMADVMHETLNRSALIGLSAGSPVNLERAMQANGRFGGHIVAGHVDGTGKIVKIERDDTAVWFTIQTKPELMRYIVEKGSVAIDGIRKRFFCFSYPSYSKTDRFTGKAERRFGESGNGYYWKVCRKAFIPCFRRAKGE